MTMSQVQTIINWQILFSRYKKFVKLKLLYPYEPLTPMFDVDLIWHTHQLCTQEYSDDTANFLGKVQHIYKYMANIGSVIFRDVKF